MSALSVTIQSILSLLAGLLAAFFAYIDFTSHEYLLVGTRIREYALHVPVDIDPENPVPLVVALHQFTDSGARMRALTGFDTIAEREGFIVAYPDGLLASWNSDADGVTGGVKFVDDERFILRLVKRLQERYNIDPNRIYLTGASNGAMMTQLMGCRHSDVFAAIAPVMGLLEKINADACKPDTPISVLLVHGTKDPIVPYEGGLQQGPRSPYYLSAENNLALWAAHGDCSGDPITTRVPPVEGETGEILLTKYSTCEPGIEVALCTVVGGGHTWPGSQNNVDPVIVGPTSYALNASEFIWEFFKNHPKPQPTD